jgi:CRP-like cAMP-binding protein
VAALVPHAALKDMLDRSPQLANAFWRDILVQVAIFQEWITSLGRREALARVAHIVCELAVRLQAVDLAHDLCLSIRLTQADLADACGISNVHANRVVQELRHLGLVEWNSNQIKIRDWGTLARCGDFSGNYLHCSAWQGAAPYER